MVKSLFFIVFIVSIHLIAWSPPPPTTFIPEHGKGFFALTGSYIKVEEELETGNRGEIEAYSGGAYFFHGFETDLAYGIGMEYISGNGDQQIINAQDQVQTVATDLQIYAPTVFLVYTLTGGAMRNGLALTVGFSKMYFKIKDYEPYDKNVIRLNLPTLTEEYRQQLSKTLSEKGEQARQTIRRQREHTWNAIQDAFKEKKISEDDKFRGKDELQKSVDEYNEKIKNLIDKKKNEII